MGLDMYLNAKRVLDEDTARRVLAILSDDERTELHDEKSYYAAMWGHYDRSEEGAAKKRRATEIMTEAGLIGLVTTDSPGGELSYDVDGALVASVHGCYWRKANAIHAWFVENCQRGVDECQESDPIPGEQLAHLAHICQQAIDAYDAGDLTKAGEFLTPTGGFFFGSTDVDEWWAEDVRRTILEIEVLVRKAIAIGGVTFTYQSSW